LASALRAWSCGAAHSRFRRRIKLLPGLWLSASKSGLSASMGKPGATLNVGGRGGPRVTVGASGTGLRYSTRTKGRGVGAAAVLLILLALLLFAPI